MITVTKSLDVFLASPVTLMIIPLTVEDALDQNNNIDLNISSQNRAG